MPMLGGAADGSRFGSTFSDAAPNSKPTSPTASRFTPGGPGAGGHFSTFPVRKSSLADAGPGQSAPPLPPQVSGSAYRPLDSGTADSTSFSAEIADALAHGSNFSPVQQNYNSVVSQGSFSVRSSTDGPAPSYESQAPPHSALSMAPSGLPRGAAPPASQWDEPSFPPPRFSQEAATPRQGEPLPLPQAPAPQYYPPPKEEEDDTELPYASPPPREAPHLPGGVDRESRNVHFGGGNSDREQVHVIGEGSMHERNPSEYDGPGWRDFLDV